MPEATGSLSTSDLTPFSFTTVATMTAVPAGKTLSYRFSSDNGSTWTSPQSSNSYSWSNLNEETTYHVQVEVTTQHTSDYGRDRITIKTIDVTTPADQAAVRMKVNNNWVHGKMYYKVNNE